MLLRLRAAVHCRAGSCTGVTSHEIKDFSAKRFVYNNSLPSLLLLVLRMRYDDILYVHILYIIYNMEIGICVCCVFTVSYAIHPLNSLYCIYICILVLFMYMYILKHLCYISISILL